MEAVSVIETEIDADFLDHFDGETDCEVITIGTPPSLLPGGIAYLRNAWLDSAFSNSASLYSLATGPVEIDALVLRHRRIIPSGHDTSH